MKFKTITSLALLSLIITSYTKNNIAQIKNENIIPTNIIPTVEFCDLTIHPELYVHKTIRIKAGIVIWWESSYLYGIDCEIDEKKLHNSIECSTDEECKQIGEQVYSIIDKNLQADSNNYAKRAYVTLIGKLIGPSPQGFGHLNGFKYEFRIMEVEKASPIPSDIPYKDE